MQPFATSRFLRFLRTHIPTHSLLYSLACTGIRGSVSVLNKLYPLGIHFLMEMASYFKRISMKGLVEWTPRVARGCERRGYWVQARVEGRAEAG